MSTIINDDFEKICVFSTQDGKSIEVIGVDNGVVKVEYSFENTPEAMARIIVGCFDNSSNFKEVIGKVYGLSSTNWFNGIELNVFDSKLLVTKANASITSISDFLRKSAEEFWENFKNDFLDALKKREETRRSIQEAVGSQKIVFKNIASERMWNSWSMFMLQKGESDRNIVVVGTAFARYVQHLIAKKQMTNWQAFEEGYDGIISNFDADESMFYQAIKMLEMCWKYGDSLKIWFEEKQEKELNKFLSEL